MNIRFPLATAALLTLAFAGTAQAGKALDAGLFTQYGRTNGTQVFFTVCGSVGGTSGCYGSGDMEPFEHACAVIEGAAKTKDNVMTRDIYVFDSGSSKSALAKLYVYTRTDTFGESSDSISTVLKKQVALNFAAGGPNAKCELVANDVTVYAAVPGNTDWAKVNKKTLAVETIQGSEPLSSITADDRGYVAIDFANGTFGIVDPKDNGEIGGGGSPLLLGIHRGARL